MFAPAQNPAAPSDADLAAQVLVDEAAHRFAAFTANDAVTLGLSIRKRFRASSRHARGKGLVISIQTVGGHTLFACTVGDLSHPSGTADVGVNSWTVLEGMINVVKQTGHSSYYVEKGIAASGKTARQVGILNVDDYAICGGAFPIWVKGAPCTPVAVAACYSGSSSDDHHLTVSTVRDYLKKLARTSDPPAAQPAVQMPLAEATAANVVEHGQDVPVPAMWQTETALSVLPESELHGEMQAYAPEGQYHGQFVEHEFSHEEHPQLVAE